MSLADDMRNISKMAVNTDTVFQGFWEKSMKVIREAATKGNNYVCFYDCCHLCDKGYSRELEQKLLFKLEENGFKVKQKWQIFGGNQITPYVVW